MNQDEEHLRLLSIFHYVVAGMMALFALFPIIVLAREPVRRLFAVQTETPAA